MERVMIPSPLWGGVGVGVASVDEHSRARHRLRLPLPTPHPPLPHKGGGIELSLPPRRASKAGAETADR
jgi:hypothetical protein